MFIDQVKVKVEAGKGGNGIVGFRREAYVPNGGPSGGDGGHGGSIVIKVDEGLNTLMDFHYNSKFKASDGGNGGTQKMTGASAKDSVIEVPAGTTVYNDKTNEVICDLIHDNDSYVVAKGGRGGRGNIHFANSKNKAPEIAENGEPGESVDIRLELKVLADVGLVGFPSVGKSTLLSAVTGSKPKVAGYHFTTLSPKLGMVKLNDGRDFAIADLPGLIEGASKGVGLGFQFLKHIERTRVLLHLIDMSGIEGRNPYEDYQKINHELYNYDSNLLKRPQIIVATKMDMPDSHKNLSDFKAKIKSENNINTRKIIPISTIRHQGLDNLLRNTSDLLDKTPYFPITDMKAKKNIEHPKQKAFNISKLENGTWKLYGNKIEKLFEMTNMDHRQGQLRFARQLNHMGVDDALQKAGAKNGDTVMILDYQFEYEQ